MDTVEDGETYAYDCAGNVINGTDAKGNTISYAYNSMGKVSSIIDQSGSKQGMGTWEYDSFGLLKKYTTCLLMTVHRNHC